MTRAVVLLPGAELCACGARCPKLELLRVVTRESEHGAVGKIECLRPEGERAVLTNFEVSRERKVDVHHVGTGNRDYIARF